MTYRALRLVASALGFAAVLTACDGGSSTGTGGSASAAPRLTLEIPGLDTIRNRVLFGSPVTITATGDDDLSLLKMNVQATRDTGTTIPKAQVVTVGVNTTFKSNTPTYSTTFNVPLDGARSGDTISVFGSVTDGNGQTVNKTLSFILFDSVPPTVRLVAPTRGVTMKSGAVTDSVRLVASDSSGLTTVGYDVLSVVGGALAVRYTVSHLVDNRKTNVSEAFLADFDTLAPGSYLIRARATDATGISSVTDTVRFNIADAIPPVLTFISPAQRNPLLIGDSIDVTVHVTDNVALKRFTLKGFSVRGDPRLGSTDTVVFYDSLLFNFTTLTTDTTMSRRLRYNHNPTNAQDSVVYFRGIVTDASLNADTSVLTQILVSGPKVIVTADSSAWPNKEVTVAMSVMDSTPSISRYGYTATMSNGVVLKDTTVFVTGVQFLTSQTTFIVPANAPIGGSITVVPRATDGSGNIGSGNTVIIPIISEPRDNVAPLVYQRIPSRFEQGATIMIDAHDPSQIRALGYELRTLPDSTLIGSGTVARAVGTRRTNDTASFVLNYDRQYRGQNAFLVSWAEDSLGNRGQSIPNGLKSPQIDPRLAKRDTVLLVYGVTYPLPAGSVAADIAVDTNAARKRVFITDVAQGGVFVWEDSSATRPAPGLRASKISVGAFPWGMALDTSGSKLFVANSGGTNIDVVDLNTLASLRGQRVQTPSSAVYDVAWSINPTSGQLKYSGFQVINYSDRPQYIAQSKNGNLYFSTRPTAAAPAGTLRRIDDPLGRPRTRQIWQYASAMQNKYTIFNADSVFIYVTTVPSGSDEIRICDTDFNTNVAYCSALHVFAEDAMADPAISTHATDVELVPNIDVTSLALPDTNFVTSGTDGRRIAFGEGATSGRPGRVITVLDSAGMSYNQALYSRPLQIRDLVNNASDRIFGIAFNQKSNYLAIHGSETFFADTALRLQGKVTTNASGAGIAFNPGNDSKNAADSVSQAFVASSDTTLEVIDSYFFRLRQKLPLRTNLYGALRVWYSFNPTTGIPLKVYGLTSEGLVVIDIRPEDLIQK
ncbi:MAG: YncE family protein [Gemmatimonadaceae bacterium]